MPCAAPLSTRECSGPPKSPASSGARAIARSAQEERQELEALPAPPQRDVDARQAAADAKAAAKGERAKKVRPVRAMLVSSRSERVAACKMLERRGVTVARLCDDPRDERQVMQITESS